MSTQKALLVTEIGKPLTLTTTHSIPTPGPNEVLLKVTIAGLNPHDSKCREWGLLIADNLPAILSNDVVGTVVSIGPGVTRYKPGDRVVSQSGFMGDLQRAGLQEYAIVDETFSSPVPEGVSDDAVASLPSNIIAGVVGLFDGSTLGIPAPWAEGAERFDGANKKILIVGGGSNCGRFAVQLAKLAGIGKIVVVGGDEGELKSFGATDVIDRHGSREVVLERIRKIVPEGFEYAFDAINEIEGQLLGLNALTADKKGKLARLIPRGEVDKSKVFGKTKGFEILDVYGSSHVKKETTAPFWERVAEYLTQGKIVPLPYYEVIKGLDVDKVNEALDRYRDGKKIQQPHVHVQG